MPNKIDLTGNRYGRLTVLSEAGRGKHGHVLWLCRCDDGPEKIIRGNSLRTGDSKSCGCLQKQRVSEANKTHGLTGTRAYKNMMEQKRDARKLNQTPQLTKEEQHRIEILYQWAQELPGIWHVDHVIPLDKDGLHHPDNLQLIPAKQNMSKNNKDPEEFYGRQYKFLCEENNQ